MKDFMFVISWIGLLAITLALHMTISEHFNLNFILKLGLAFILVFILNIAVILVNSLY